MRITVMVSGRDTHVGAGLQAAGEEGIFIARGTHLRAPQQSGSRIEAPANEL